MHVRGFSVAEGSTLALPRDSSHQLAVLRIWCCLDLGSAQPQCYGRNNVFLGVDNLPLLKLPPLLTRTSGLRYTQSTRMRKECFFFLLFENDLVGYPTSTCQPFFSSHFRLKRTTELYEQDVISTIIEETWRMRL